MQLILQRDPLTQLKSWVIIEMQGDLESRVGDTQMSSKFIGDLHYTKSGGTPVLIIGHHILYGKVVDLERPFVAAAKQMIQQQDEDESTMEVDGSQQKSSAASSEIQFKVEAIIRKKIIFKTRPKPIIANVPKKI